MSEKMNVWWKALKPSECRRALTALNASIAHWERLRDNAPFPGMEEPTAAWCALCEAFADCIGCPVAKDFSRNCYGTSYYAARRAWRAYGGNSAEFKQKAAVMVDELQSLLPTEEIT